MNPLTNMRNLNKMNDREIAMGTAGDDKRSWHGKYRGSAWVYAGGLPYNLTEGDIICVFSQYGELVNINLIRDQKTGKSKGFCFLCYEDQRSTNLAVDNLNGCKIVGRMVRVDHVDEYKVPKLHDDTSDATKSLYAEGCAPKPIKEARRPDEQPSEGEEEKTPPRAVDTDMLLPIDKDQAKDIKRVKKRLKREAKEARRALKRKMEEEMEFDRAHGGTGDMKPTPSAWSWSKPKEGSGMEIGMDDADFKPDHRVTMAHFDTLKIKERHLGKAAVAAEMGYHEQEILKLEKEREKRLAGDKTKGLKKGDKTYVPKRFTGHSSARL